MRLLQVLSDLHIEKLTRVPQIPQAADHLLLAGDIGHPQKELYHEFLYRCSRKYATIVLVNGNHEWDRGDPKPFQENLPENVKLLENGCLHLSELGVYVLGCTLWTPVTRVIENSVSIDFLRKNLTELQTETVMCLTHHLPSYKLIIPKYRHLEKRHSRFANHLDWMFSASFAPKYWVCGHSHCFLDKHIGRTRCVINTVGQQKTAVIQL